MNSYVTDYATPSKNSRVSVRPRAFSAFESIAVSMTEKPVFVFPDVRGAYVVVQGELSTLQVFERSSGRQTVQAGKGDPEHWDTVLMLPDDQFVFRVDRFTMAGEQFKFLGTVGYAGINVASRYVDGRYTSLTQEVVVKAGESVSGDNRVGVRCERPGSMHKEWRGQSLDGFGTGAIFADGRVVVVMNDGRLRVYADADGRILVDRQLQGAPYKVSVVGEGLAVLVPTPPIPESEEPDWDTVKRIHTLRADHPLGFHWSTELRVLTDQGDERWRVTVPFEGMQPPIAGASGRLYVAGYGLAAAEQGRVVWSASSPVLMRATAFGEGTLAVAVGAALRIVDADGHIRQEFHTQGQEPILTPPAIASDGSVLVATRQRLYVLR